MFTRAAFGPRAKRAAGSPPLFHALIKPVYIRALLYFSFSFVHYMTAKELLQVIFAALC